MSHGVYVLFLHVPYPMSMSVGGLGRVDFKPGYYAYVGSALGGLEGRVRRHFRREKKLYWHIDHLLLRARAVDLLVAKTGKRVECELAKRLSKAFPAVDGFGASDCRCPSHLFYAPRLYELTRAAAEAMRSLGLMVGRRVE